MSSLSPPQDTTKLVSNLRDTNNLVSNLISGQDTRDDEFPWRTHIPPHVSEACSNCRVPIPTAFPTVAEMDIGGKMSYECLLCGNKWTETYTSNCEHNWIANPYQPEILKYTRMFCIECAAEKKVPRS